MKTVVQTSNMMRITSTREGDCGRPGVGCEIGRVFWNAERLAQLCIGVNPAHERPIFGILALSGMFALVPFSFNTN